MKSLISIIHDNYLAAMNPLNKGISTTRNQNFEKSDRFIEVGNQLEARIELDGNKLSEHYKIKPRNDTRFFNNTKWNLYRVDKDSNQLGPYDSIEKAIWGCIKDDGYYEGNFANEYYGPDGQKYNGDDLYKKYYDQYKDKVKEQTYYKDETFGDQFGRDATPQDMESEEFICAKRISDIKNYIFNVTLYSDKYYFKSYSRSSREEMLKIVDQDENQSTSSNLTIDQIANYIRNQGINVNIE
jgi:hypothetical protein